MRTLAIALAATLMLGSVGAQTLVFGQSGLPVTLDTGQDGNSLLISYQVLDNLVGFAPGSVTLIPGLATEWSANDDATVWTFTLREGVTFHDGTPFDADAVKFNFERWNDRSHPYAFAGQGKSFTAWIYIFSSFYGEEGYLLESVEVVDPTTVRFHLTSSVGFFPAMVASSYFGIHSPTAVMAGGLPYGTPGVGIVGTGPFVFTEWLDGDRVTLTRNDAYWGDTALVERIVFRGIEAAATRLAELEAGTLDIAVDLSPEDFPLVERNANLRPAFADADLRIGYVGFHQSHPPFDDVRVRRAVAHAVDLEAIVDAFFGDMGAVAAEFVPPGLIGRAELEPAAYDPERARELLAEAGFADGFSTEFWYMPVSRPYFPAPQDLAEAFVGYLSDVGIQAELRTQEWGLYLDEYTEGKFPMYMLGWSADYADPNNFIYTFFGPAEIGPAFGWTDAHAQETLRLLAAALSAGSVPEREANYVAAARIIGEQVPALPVVYPRSLNAVRVGIEGFQPSPLGSVVSFAGISKR
jgi:peptide/nickel transport system substrate-binding protein